MSDYGVLNRFLDLLEHRVYSSLVHIDCEQTIPVAVLESLDVGVPLFETLLHDFFTVLSSLDKTVFDRPILRRRHLHVVEFACVPINHASAQFLNAFLARLIEDTAETWLDSHGLEQVNLLLSLGEPVQYPAVQSTVALVEPLVDHTKQYFIWNSHTRLDCLLHLDLDGWILLSLSKQDLLWANRDKPERVSDHARLGGAPRTGWPDDEHSGGSPRGVASELKSKHSSKIVNNVILELISALVLEDELVECRRNRIHVHLLIFIQFARNLIHGLPIKARVYSLDFLLERCHRNRSWDIQVDELVRDDCHLLKR